jgi:hypothetical protein
VLKEQLDLHLARHRRQLVGDFLEAGVHRASRSSR